MHFVIFFSCNFSYITFLKFHLQIIIDFILHHDPVFSLIMASGGAKEATASPFLRISDVAQESLEFLPPIGGYAKQPLVSLEEAVKSLISILPDVESHVYVAKQNCKNPADDLTQDESASIMLYTMEWEPHDECLYVVLNNTLRSKNRNKTLKLWYPYLRLFLNALYRLPPIANTFYRGVKENLIERYKKDSTVVWWGFSSCTKAVGVLNNDSFLGKTGERTLFTVRCNSARDISKHSMFETEAEVLLLAATQFQVIDCLDQGGLHIIQLEETIPPAPLLQPVPIIGSLPENSIKVRKLLQRIFTEILFFFFLDQCTCYFSKRCHVY